MEQKGTIDPSCIDTREMAKRNRGPIREIWDTKIVPMKCLAFDPGADWQSRAIAIGALIYLISPIDAVPDALPGGLLDDVAVILVAAKQIVDVLRKYVDD